MKQCLDCGQYYGAVLEKMITPSAVLVETRHPARAYIPSHSHRNAYFCFVQRGTYNETFGLRSRECGPLTLAFHPPEEVHSEQTESEVQSFNMEVEPIWLNRVREMAPVLREPIDCSGGPPAWLALQLFKEFRQRDSVSFLAVEGLLLEIVAALTRSASIPQDGPVWLRRVEDLLRSRFNEAVTLSELAEEAGVHPIHLASVFRKRFGCSVGEFVRQLRVDRAASLLAHPRASLAEIALLTGFADQSHFTRIFKRATGLTPAAYRQAFLA